MSKTSNACDQTASYEDKLLEKFEEWFHAEVPDGRVLKTDAMIIWSSSWKACAAIKDAEIAKLHTLVNAQTVCLQEHHAEIASRDLMIKELREALLCAKQFINNGIEFGYIRMPDKDTPDTAHDTPKIVSDALTNSEHRNPSALEKKLLEARIDELKIINSKYFVQTTASIRLNDLQDELAELNKE